MAYTESVIQPAIDKAASQAGFASLSIEQRESIARFVSGKDIFVSLPTGAGKSICYMLLPLVFDLLREVPGKSIIIVVSPLKSLMDDQVARFSSRGIKSALVSRGGMQSGVAEGVVRGEFQIVMLSPEAMLTDLKWREMFRSKVYHDNLVGLVIDEAHCVEKWGAEFRTEFANISEVRSLVPHGTCLMALTATATAKTRHVIMSSLDMQGCHLVYKAPNKLNIKYHVHSPCNIEDMVLPVVDEISLRGVNANRSCRTYRDTLEVYKTLVCMLGRRNCLYAPSPGDVQTNRLRLCEKYDGSTFSENQKHIVQSFTKADGVVRVVVGTIAFGLGLDSPNVRSIIHLGAPDDIHVATYVQETGRGGRDGKLCNAILYDKKQGITCSDLMRAYCSNTTQCRRDFLMAVFSGKSSAINKPSPLHACCDICSHKCECTECNILMPNIPEGEVQALFMQPQPDIKPSKKLKLDLHQQLLKYRAGLVPSEQSVSSFMIGVELLTGISNSCIEEVVDKCMQINDISILVDMGLPYDIAQTVFQIIHDTVISHKQ